MQMLEDETSVLANLIGQRRVAVGYSPNAKATEESVLAGMVPAIRGRL
jgi:hypothetical protein